MGIRYSNERVRSHIFQRLTSSVLFPHLFYFRFRLMSVTGSDFFLKSCRFGLEWVADMLRIWWPPWFGINGRLAPDYASVAGAKLPIADEWMRSCDLVCTLLTKSTKNINDFLTKPSSVISVTEVEVQLLGNYQTETDKLITDMQVLIDGLKETDEESARATTIINFRSLLEHYERWLSLCEQKRKYDVQIEALDTMIRELEQTERNEFNNVLNQISADVNDFYIFLHPNEGFDQLRLSSTQDRGLEFEFIYKGDPISPPGKLMSESHLNTLGLCFFLASVIHYNQQCEFVVLDDVVSSVDASHRLALARLLRDEPRLNQRQYIILSHDMYWSDLLKRTFPNWAHKKISN